MNSGKDATEIFPKPDKYITKKNKKPKNNFEKIRERLNATVVFSKPS
jgi:hypothetical protein